MEGEALVLARAILKARVHAASLLSPRTICAGPALPHLLGLARRDQATVLERRLARLLALAHPGP